MTNSKVPGSKVLVTALFVGLLSIVSLHAQAGVSAYEGRFTVVQPIQWNTTVLQPGDYVITIPTAGSIVMASVRTASGSPVVFLMNCGQNDTTNRRNTLLLKEKDGRMQVYSLVLADLGKVLIYNPALARQALLESQGRQTLPLVLAKR
jgi:hypothetical protein